MMQKEIYLDYAAATPMDERVLARMTPFFSVQFYNPSALYEPALLVKKALTEARADVALCMGARPSEIIFTAGGTEANNLAIHGVMEKYPTANIVVSAIEHEAVMEPAKNYDVRIAQVNEQGTIDLQDLAAKIDGNTVLVSVMYANNEIGTIQPLKEIAQLIGAKRAERSSTKIPILFHSDACQVGNYLDLHASRLGVDMLTLNGGKIYGPKQSGALFIKAGLELAPLIRGGGQERGLRSGTENVAAAIGFSEALMLAQADRHTETARLQQLQTVFFKLIRQKLPHATVHGSLKKRLPNNVHVTIPGTDNERVLLLLEQRGILASAGSACSASNDTSSHVLLALGLSDTQARTSLRFSLGRGTVLRDIHNTVEALAAITG